MVVTPPLRNDAGPVDVTVVNLHDDEELVATAPAPYTYRLRAYPVVSAITPATAVAGEATTPVTISGTNLFDRPIQSHVFGDIVRRKVTAGVRWHWVTSIDANHALPGALGVLPKTR